MSDLLRPSLIMETSWEVCNKVGGIYTVLSTRAASMIEKHGREGVIFIGPWLKGREQVDFIEEESNLVPLIVDQCGIEVRFGYWDVPGRPRVLLVDYSSLYQSKGELYYEMWSTFGIRSELGYGDYDESCLFAIAAAKVMSANHQMVRSESSIAIFNEWTTGMGLLYCRVHSKDIRTIFITHATTVGRSIAGNSKPLYGELSNYHGDQMAQELNVVCKHIVEKMAAHYSDVFATVSEVTAKEAEQLLKRKVDCVLYNGFEQGFIPSEIEQKEKRRNGRARIKRLAEVLYGTVISSRPLIIATSGRNEYRNKGLDVMIDALSRMNGGASQDIIALITVPSWVKAPRKDLLFALEHNIELTMPMQTPFLTHELFEPQNNRIFLHLSSLRSEWGKSVFPIFIPDYLSGDDGVLNMNYYDFLTTLDLTIFPSYYEPWGYTPLESIAFGVPTITTDKAGFGMWAMREVKGNDLGTGVQVLHRDDHNFDNLSERIKEVVLHFSEREETERSEAKQAARNLSKKADWSCFYPRYEEAMSLALSADRNGTL